MRLDKLLAEELEGVSRSAAQSLIGQGLVTSAGKILSKSAKLAAGQLVQVVLPEPKALDVLPEEIPLEIVFEDDDLISDAQKVEALKLCFEKDFYS